MDWAESVSILASAPKHQINGFIRALRKFQSNLVETSIEELVLLLPQEFRSNGRSILLPLERQSEHLDFELVAAAIEAAVLVRNQVSNLQEVELVWSGPDQAHSTFRRTDRVWVDLIDMAEESIWLASFNVGSVKRIQQALQAAIGRGVQVKCLFETPEDSDGYLQWDPLRNLDTERLNGCFFYRWPSENREPGLSGRSGLMHAKCIVIDESAMFVTSANLSAAALETNIEVGVVVRGGAQPKWLSERFNALLSEKLIQKLAF